MAISVSAPAKINLTLHVTGQRADGYHLLDSLVVFGGAQDLIRIEPADVLSLTVDGPEAAAVPADMGNLVLQVARLLGPDRGARITLTKSLPVASGIGGGSADAAATVRGLLRLWQIADGGPAADRALRAIGPGVLALGADIPVCLQSRPARMRGIGEDLAALPPLPPLPAVLVNPRLPVSTPAVFRRLTEKANTPMPLDIPAFATVAAFAGWLQGQRNDLQAAARALQPAVGTVLDALGDCAGCLLARMSGSGATCFGLFADVSAAQGAAERLRRDWPGWWIADGMLGEADCGARNLS